MEIKIPNSGVESIKVACCNWPDMFPYVPQVDVDLWSSGNSLFLDFKVSEQYTLGVVDTDNGEAWTDSCVELFIAPDDSGYYYNFEFTCTGKLLLAYRPGREGAEVAPLSVVAMVKREASLGNKPVGLLHNCSWSLRVEIPISALFKHDFTTWSGLKARGNIYKCGNNLPEKHFVSFAPISTPKPDFHRPEFFVPIQID